MYQDPVFGGDGIWLEILFTPRGANSKTTHYLSRHMLFSVQYPK